MQETLPTPVIRALIIDDHDLFNEGLKSILKNESSIEVVGQVYHSQDTLRYVDQLSPDILLMDFNMPGINGLEMTHQLLANSKNINILILSMYNEQRYIDDFRNAGAKGYLLKTVGIDELVKAIHVVASGKSYFVQKSIRNVKSENHSNDDFLKKLKLTKREREVISYILEGFTNQEIADVMFISFNTVETHRRNIYFKLNVKNTAELIQFMAKNS